MRSVNKVILVGNVTRDPLVKDTANGQIVATFGLATNRSWTSGDGDKNSSTEFHELVVWSKLAEFARDHLKTGKLVYVEGYLKTRNWEHEDGTKKFKTEIVVQDLIILSKRGDQEDEPTTENQDHEMQISDDNIF